MPRYSIDVNVSPQAQPPATAPQTDLTPATTPQSDYTQRLSIGGIAKTAIGLGALQSVGSTIVGSVGDFTGNRELQRSIDLSQRLVGFGVQIAIGGAIGVAAVGAQLISERIQTVVKRNNENMNSRYLGTLRGNRYLGNR